MHNLKNLAGAICLWWAGLLMAIAFKLMDEQNAELAEKAILDTFHAT